MKAVILRSEFWNGGWINSTDRTSYVGTNYNDYYTYAMHFTAPEFIGISKSVDVLLGMTSGGDNKTPTLRWALCTSDANKALYVDNHEEVTDEYQIASGIFATGKLSSIVSYQQFSIRTDKVKPLQEYTLFIWGYAPPSAPEWADILATPYHTVSVETIGGIVHLVINGAVRIGTPVVKHGGEIRGCMAGAIRNGKFRPGG